MPETPRELTIPEIHTLVEQFGDCAKRAKAAGFDAVEVHGAHGYLAGAFASPFSNKRSDEYGGTIRNRARFGMEIIRNIKEKCGEDYPVLYRISSVEYVPGGLGIEESKVIARLMEEASADCIHCSQGVYASTHTIIPPSVFPRAGYVEHAAEMKKAVQIPVIAVGRINDVEIAESVLQSKKADLVTMARASLADPELPNKVLKGRGDEVIRCISCLQGCIGENGKGNGIRCLVNPLTGMEDEYDLTPAEKAKQVLVIGGGIAGCEAAISAALKGHKVTLIEKNDRLGGQWIPASVPIGKSEFTSFLCWQKSMLEKMHVQILLNTTADAELIKLYEPDTVIIATGSRPFIPPIQGADQDFVVTAHDVLLGKTEPGNRVVVIGGGNASADHERWRSSSNKIHERAVFPKRSSDSYFYKTFGNRRSYGNRRKDGERFVLENIDTVIIAVGVKTDRTLLDSMEHVSCKVLKVGDANGVKNGYLGIREGYEAGLNA